MNSEIINGNNRKIVNNITENNSTNATNSHLLK